MNEEKELSFFGIRISVLKSNENYCGKSCPHAILENDRRHCRLFDKFEIRAFSNSYHKRYPECIYLERLYNVIGGCGK
jgi:hypothetical protein